MNASSISAGVNGQLGLALLLMMSLGTEAAQAATAEPTIEEIVVTARRTQENLQDVPMVITAFDSDDLERKSIRNSRDLMFHTPSLTARTSQGGLHGGYSIRGLSGGVTTYNYHAEAPLGPRTVTGTLSPGNPIRPRQYRRRGPGHSGHSRPRGLRCRALRHRRQS